MPDHRTPHRRGYTRRGHHLFPTSVSGCPKSPTSSFRQRGRCRGAASGPCWGQFDAVLSARPDLLPLLIRAYNGRRPASWHDTFATLQKKDNEALQAVLLAVAGGYYAHPQVRRALGYTGQVPEEVRPDIYPKYVDEGLIERVLARYRPRAVPEPAASPRRVPSTPTRKLPR